MQNRRAQISRERADGMPEISVDKIQLVVISRPQLGSGERSNDDKAFFSQQIVSCIFKYISKSLVWSAKRRTAVAKYSARSF